MSGANGYLIRTGEHVACYSAFQERHSVATVCRPCRSRVVSKERSGLVCIPSQLLAAPARPDGFLIRLASCLRVDVCDRWPLDGGLADDAMAIRHGEPKRALPLQLLEPREAILLTIFD